MKNNCHAIKAVNEHIKQAAERSGHSVEDITLVAVSKTRPIEDIIAVYETGVRHFGENRTEELAEKAAALSHLPDLKWHFIGNLQTRQSKIVAEHANCFHAVDRVKIARRLSSQLIKFDRRLPVFIQINVSGEASKSGFQCDNWQTDASQTENLIQAIKEITILPHLEVQGLMTMAPFGAPQDTLREIFKSMAELSAYLHAKLPDIPAQKLSMGMSGDFEIAIEEGATHVRIGSAIFT